MKLLQNLAFASGLAAAVFSVSSVQAATVEVNSGVAYIGSGGSSSGRGQGFEMLADTSVTSVGIEGNLKALNYTVDIYGSTNGHAADGGLLASFSAALGGGGFGWYDMAISYAFLASDFYVVNWRPTIDSTNWVVASGGGPGNPGIQYYYDSGLPTVSGQFKLVEGFSGASVPLFSQNFLHPNMRYDVGVSAVPVPASLPLLAAAIAAFGFSRSRRRKA